MSLIMRMMTVSALGLALLVPLCFGQTPAPQTVASSPGGWQAAAPRQEISPQFAFNPMGGPKGTGSWAIAADGRDGLHGYWRKAFPVVGGKTYRFSAVRKTVDVSEPRRSAVARILWQDGQGRSVRADPPNEADAKANLPI